MTATTIAGLPGYAELACRSNFSFLTGASHPEELVARARALRYTALALTDEGTLGGVVRAHAEARRLGLPLIIGATMQLAARAAATGPSGPCGTAGPGGPSGAADAPGPRLVLLAQTRRGYGNLAQWITVARRRAPKGEYRALMSDLEGKVPDTPTLAGLPECFALLMSSSVLGVPGSAPFETLFAQAVWLHTWFGRERCAIALPLLLHPHDALLADVKAELGQ